MMSELVLESDSGLSQIERINTRSMGRLLQQAGTNPNGGILRNTLPVVGMDGTIRNRLIWARVAGNIGVKTDTLDSVHTIAGYVEGGDDQRLAVVSMISHLDTNSGQTARDALLRWVYQGVPR